MDKATLNFKTDKARLNAVLEHYRNKINELVEWANAADAAPAAPLPSHAHDDRYYTEAETDAFFEGEDAGRKQTHWDRVISKPATFAPAAHTHAHNDVANAWLGSNYTLTAAWAGQKLPLNTVIYDPGGNFSVVNNRYVCPVGGDGYYLVVLQARIEEIAGSAAYGLAYLSRFRGAAQTNWCRVDINPVPANSGITYGTAALLHLQAGDYLEVYGYGGSTGIRFGASHTFLSLTKVAAI